MRASERLRAAGLTLPEPPQPTARFVAAKRFGDLLYVSGQGPNSPDGGWHRGKVGQGVSLEDARKHARLTGLNVLAAAQKALGDLDAVEGVVKLLGFVNASPDFHDHSKVIDGCSELFLEVLGEAGEHARSAIGVSSLPNNITVEIEAIFSVRRSAQ